LRFRGGRGAERTAPPPPLLEREPESSFEEREAPEAEDREDPESPRERELESERDEPESDERGVARSARELSRLSTRGAYER
jgi:hypothetical protein